MWCWFKIPIAQVPLQKDFSFFPSDNNDNTWLGFMHLNPREPWRKKATWKLESVGWGGGSIGPPSTFHTIHPIGMTFGTLYNKIPLHFQLSETMWFLIGFHDNQSYLMMLQVAARSWIFKFSDFTQIWINYRTSKWQENSIWHMKSTK